MTDDITESEREQANLYLKVERDARPLPMPSWRDVAIDERVHRNRAETRVRAQDEEIEALSRCLGDMNEGLLQYESELRELREAASDVLAAWESTKMSSGPTIVSHRGSMPAALERLAKVLGPTKQE